MNLLKRRQLISLSSGLLLSAGVGAEPTVAKLLTKAIPNTHERIPVIGMGTWITFNVGNAQDQRLVRCQVLETFFKAGGTVIDSSPMYGSAEEVVGYCLNKTKRSKEVFSTTKVWTPSEREGKKSFQNSKRYWGLPGLSLYLVHNLVNWKGHFPFLRELKRSGQIRYLGVSTSHGRRHSELQTIMETQDIDFVQLSYNAANRKAEERLLPLAAERGIAVLANRPFQTGRLIDRANRHPLPAWAASLGCASWAQLLLKYVVSHKAVTCSIPATSRVDHMEDNMQACRGRLLEARERKLIADAIKNL